MAAFSTIAIVAASALSGDVTYQTPNFVVTAANAELAREIGDTAETCQFPLSGSVQSFIESIGRPRIKPLAIDPLAADGRSEY